MHIRSKTDNALPWFSLRQFRNPSTHKMRPWVRKFFLHFLPKVLMIQRPADKRPRKWPLVNGPVSEEHRQEVAPLHEKGGQRPDVLLSHGFDRYVLGKDIQNVVDGINYISEQVKETTVTNHVSNTYTTLKASLRAFHHVNSAHILSTYRCFSKLWIACLPLETGFFRAAFHRKTKDCVDSFTAHWKIFHAKVILY